MQSGLQKNVLFGIRKIMFQQKHFFKEQSLQQTSSHTNCWLKLKLVNNNLLLKWNLLAIAETSVLKHLWKMLKEHIEDMKTAVPKTGVRSPCVSQTTMLEVLRWSEEIKVLK